MFNILQERTKLIAFVGLMTLLASCDLISNKTRDKPKDEQKDLVPMLQASFEKLYYAKYALDFPHTESALNHCVEYNNEPCLEVYKQFQEGKDTLQSISSDESLLATLDIIEQACLSEEQNIATSICYGAIMSLYFYNSSNQDAIIFKRVNEFSKAINNIVFNHDFLWFHNRPNVINWHNYISTLEIDWEQRGQKQFVLNSLNKNINQIEGEPWVLR